MDKSVLFLTKMSLRRLTFVTIVVFITTEAVSGEYVIKAVGDQVSFRPDKPLPSPVTSIIWKHINNDGTVNKAIEWDEGEILIPNPRFKGITTVDEKTGQINITNLNCSHSGVYTIDINSKEQEQEFNLTVKVCNSVSQQPPVYERDLFEDGSGSVLLGILITITIIQIIIIICHFVLYEVSPDFLKFVEDCCPLIEGLYSPAQTNSNERRKSNTPRMA